MLRARGSPHHRFAVPLPRKSIEEALADSRPSIPANKVFKELRARHTKLMRAGKKGRAR